MLHYESKNDWFGEGTAVKTWEWGLEWGVLRRLEESGALFYLVSSQAQWLHNVEGDSLAVAITVLKFLTLSISLAHIKSFRPVHIKALWDRHPDLIGYYIIGRFDRNISMMAVA
jgi:hypothetical protein